MKILEKIKKNYNKGKIVLNRARLERLAIYLSTESINELFYFDYDLDNQNTYRRFKTMKP